MSVTLEEFVKLLEDSGILSGDELHEFIPPRASPQSVEELARELVRRKRLTEFQAEELCQGNTRSLVLGNYLLLEKIGAGGMGHVFKAHHRRMDRMVAVKLLPESLTRNPSAIARFEREVKAAARLNHPNIVTAFDADCANGVHFLVMELVDGSDLSSLVRQNGPFSVERAVDCILQAARGLEAAHTKGIVHRDVKPGNLLLDRDGVVKILDLGLARLNAAGETATPSGLTESGAILGTVDYMAPEQALDTRTADVRADIYALGCSLYFLLTGKPLYPGDTLMKKLLAHREQPIPLLGDACPGVSESLERVFRKMVAKQTTDRYQAIAPLLVELEGCRRHPERTVVLGPSADSAADAAFSHPPVSISDAETRTDVSNRSTVSNVNTRIPFGPLLAAALCLAALLVTGGLWNRFKPDEQATQTTTGQFSSATTEKPPNSTGIADGSERTSAPAGAKKPLAYQSPGFARWIAEVAAMPAEKQVQSVASKLVELNPGFDGVVLHTLSGTKVVGLDFFTDAITDISPIRAIPGLKTLMCSASGPGLSTRLSDLSPLEGLSLTFLTFNYTHVDDLSPLRGMPLEALKCDGARISDLTPLSEMPLIELQLARNPIATLEPLRGIRLQQLHLDEIDVDDLSPLKGMPLTLLSLRGMRITDLSLLADMPLHHLCLEFQPDRDGALLHSIGTLETINETPVDRFWSQVPKQP